MTLYFIIIFRKPLFLHRIKLFGMFVQIPIHLFKSIPLEEMNSFVEAL